MSKIDYQKLREIAEKTKIAGEAPVMPFDQRINALNDFMKHFSPDIALALLDERERNQQYIKRRDQENEDIALTVGKLRVELEAAEKRIAELESGSQAQKLVKAIIVAIENEQERLFDEDYLMDSKECIDVIREEVKRWNDSRAAGIRIKGDAGEQNDEKP
ncbi:TPA: ead/Ea22-like family protein [Escherichia coli]|nr:ead/Ea22-like family protein [Escherichia coli]HAO0123131.1 ead/Ea22-like family protein [Escherichia coli]